VPQFVGSSNALFLDANKIVDDRFAVRPIAAIADLLPLRADVTPSGRPIIFSPQGRRPTPTRSTGFAGSIEARFLIAGRRENDYVTTLTPLGAFHRPLSSSNSANKALRNRSSSSGRTGLSTQRLRRLRIELGCLTRFRYVDHSARLSCAVINGDLVRGT
jgi:hypothetical protein